MNNKPEWEPQEIEARDMLKGFFRVIGWAAIGLVIGYLIGRYA